MKIGNQKMNSIALIGYGYWGQKVYKTLLEVFDPKQVLIVDPFFSGNKNNLPFTTTKKIIHDPQVKKVFIATPEETHFELAKIFLESGKDVFVEKPLCLKGKEAKILIDLAKKKKLKLYVDYTFIFDPYVQKIKTLINQNVIGELNHIESTRHSININKPNVTVFDDLATHDIYLGRYFFGENQTGFSTIKEKINSHQVNQAHLILNYQDKSLSAHYSWAQPQAARKMVFFGTSGTLIWDRVEKDILEYQNFNHIASHQVDELVSPLKKSIDIFINSNVNQNYFNDVEILEKIDSSLSQ